MRVGHQRLSCSHSTGEHVCGYRVQRVDADCASGLSEGDTVAQKDRVGERQKRPQHLFSTSDLGYSIVGVLYILKKNLY